MQECLLWHCCDNRKQANCLVITKLKQGYIHKMEQYDVIKMINIYIHILPIAINQILET